MKVPDTEVRLVVDLSGPGATEGKRMADGVNLASEDIGKTLKGIRVSIEDDRCDPSLALEKAKKALADKVAVVVGHNCGQTSPAASKAYQGNLTFISMSSTGAFASPSPKQLQFSLSPGRAAMKFLGSKLAVDSAQNFRPIDCELVKTSGKTTSVRFYDTSAGAPTDPMVCDRPPIVGAPVVASIQALSKRLGYPADAAALKGYSALFAAAAAINLANGSPKRSYSDVLASERFYTGFGQFSFDKQGLLTPSPVLTVLPSTASQIDASSKFKSSQTIGSGDDPQMQGRRCTRNTCEVANACKIVGINETCISAAICAFDCR